MFLPYTTPRLKIQVSKRALFKIVVPLMHEVFDKDRIGPNDAIAEANLNLKGFFQKALKNKSAKIGILTSEGIHILFILQTMQPLIYVK